MHDDSVAPRSRTAVTGLRDKARVFALGRVPQQEAYLTAMIETVESLAATVDLDVEIEVLKTAAWLTAVPERVSHFLKESGVDSATSADLETLVRAAVQDVLDADHGRGAAASVLHDSMWSFFGNPVEELLHVATQLGLIGEASTTTSSDLAYLVDRLQRHAFVTAFAKSHWEPGKSSNLHVLAKRLKALRKEEAHALEGLLHVDAAELKRRGKKLAKIEGMPERGVETLFRLTSKNHYTLKRMVDAKASILLSINAIVVSVLLGTIVPNLDRDPHLLVPTLMLLMSSMISITYGVMASRPDREPGARRVDLEDDEAASSLYFGRFYWEGREAFRERMLGLMEDRDALYHTLIDDIFSVGVELHRKYAHLRRSFDAFQWGFTLSVIAFVVCHIFLG